MYLKWLLVTIVLHMASFDASATPGSPGTGNETENNKNDIAGGVLHANTKKPIGHVNVTAYAVDGKEKIVITDAKGLYSFTDLKSGVYQLVFEKTGYKKVVREQVKIRSDEGCQLDVLLYEKDDFYIIPGQLFSDL